MISKQAGLATCCGLRQSALRWKTATGTGALPGKVPVGGRAPAPANGGLGWTNGAKGSLNFCRAKAAKSRSDALIIAQPFMAGSGVNQMKSPVRDGRRILSSLTGLGTFPNREPSHKWLGYFQGKRRDGENGNRDGRAPQQCPSWWPCASTGQWQFGMNERGKGRLNFCEHLVRLVNSILIHLPI